MKTDGGARRRFPRALLPLSYAGFLLAYPGEIYLRRLHFKDEDGWRRVKDLRFAEPVVSLVTFALRQSSLRSLLKGELFQFPLNFPPPMQDSTRAPIGKNGLFP